MKQETFDIMLIQEQNIPSCCFVRKEPELGLNFDVFLNYDQDWNVRPLPE